MRKCEGNKERCSGRLRERLIDRDAQRCAYEHCGCPMHSVLKMVNGPGIMMR